MIDWQWIPGVVVGGGAAGHSLWLRTRFDQLRARYDEDVKDLLIELQRQLIDQKAHAMMLWPRPWQGNRPLTQVEELVESGKGWLGEPLDPEQQRAKMMADAERLLDSYDPKRDGG